jgi:hypothetical protein
MLLSGNAEVAFPSTAATTTLAANRPTPATAAATSNVTAAVATLSPIAEATSTFSVSADDIVASVLRKRKAFR